MTRDEYMALTDGAEVDINGTKYRVVVPPDPEVGHCIAIIVGANTRVLLTPRDAMDMQHMTRPALREPCFWCRGKGCNDCEGPR